MKKTLSILAAVLCSCLCWAQAGLSYQQNLTISSTGSANAYVLTPIPAVASLSNWCGFFVANFANTGAATLAVSGLTAKNITKNGLTATALASADIGINQVVVLCYDGTQFELVSHVANISAITIAGTSVGLGGSTSSLPSPGPIGATTQSTGAFTTGTFSTSITCTATACLGSATATTQAQGTNSTVIATTAYVDGQNMVVTSGLTAGHAYYVSAANTLSEAGGGISATTPAVCVAISTTQCLGRGTYTTTSLTAGAVYYVPTTAAVLTSTAPSTSGQFVQRLGVALSTTVLLINPSLDVGTVQ